MFREVKRDGGTDSSTGVELSLPILKFPRPARCAAGWRSLRRRPMVASQDRGVRPARSATELVSDTQNDPRWSGYVEILSLIR